MHVWAIIHIRTRTLYLYPRTANRMYVVHYNQKNTPLKYVVSPTIKFIQTLNFTGYTFKYKNNSKHKYIMHMKHIWTSSYNSRITYFTLTLLAHPCGRLIDIARARRSRECKAMLRMFSYALLMDNLEYWIP